MHLDALLAEKRSNIIKKWRDLIIATYPGDAKRFLRKEKNRFANPVGQTVSKEAGILFDELIKDAVDLENVFTSRHPVRALTVTGDSMIDEHICDGDVVVYEERKNPRNGDTVVALVDGDEATLKKFYKEKSRVRLQPANPKYKPIYTRNVDILGVVIGVMRQC